VPRPRDVVTERPKILFVGINPGTRSGKVGHHFAGPANPFWRLLHAARLVPVVLRADEDQRLAEFGYGLVNLCGRSTKTAAELTRAELARGAKQLRKKIRAMQPEVVALVGVTLYPVLFGRTDSRGPGAKPERLEGARVFVVPNPSGLNASFPSFGAKLTWFEQLREFADT
jgi:TDG/mug DNA glycosylase family protein